MQELAGKVAFVTGDVNDIGLRMTRSFLIEGMRVAITDWSSSHIDMARTSKRQR